jgi:hypothetical protein
MTLCQHCGARATVYLCPTCEGYLRTMLNELPWAADAIGDHPGAPGPADHRRSRQGRQPITHQTLAAWS